MRTTTLTRWLDPAPAVAGLVVLVHLAAIRLSFWSDGTRVLFFGIPVGSDCAFRTHFGFPCPACGLTRSVSLTLLGNWGQAMELNVAGPLAVVGLVLLAAGLLWLALDRAGSPVARSWVKMASLGYAAAAFTLWIAIWMFRISSPLA